MIVKIKLATRAICAVHRASSHAFRCSKRASSSSRFVTTGASFAARLKQGPFSSFPKNFWMSRQHFDQMSGGLFGH